MATLASVMCFQFSIQYEDILGHTRVEAPITDHLGDLALGMGKYKAVQNLLV